jgi:uncharacterized LabA/DUF88 family protein
MRRNALILIDASNIKYYLKEKGWQISWPRFRDYFKRLYHRIDVIYYEGIRTKAVFFDHKPTGNLNEFLEAKAKKLDFFKTLKSIGFKVVTKLVSRVYDHTDGRFRHKCNFDVEITVAAIDQMDEYDEFVLCSGDGDFVKLLKYLKAHKKKTVVVAPGERLSWLLAKASNQVVFLEDLRAHIEET